MKNQKSIQLIKGFTAELLGGDIDNLVTFDIKQLRGNKKYGGCNGSSFDSDKSISLQDYIHAKCNYLDYCEPLINNRGKRIVEILKKKVIPFD